MWRELSYRYRIPISLAATVLFTALVIGLVLAWHTFQNVRIDLIDNSNRLGYALASAIQPALKHDDVWQAYNILRGTRQAAGKIDATLIILDNRQRIFASSQPTRYPVAMPLAAIDKPLARFLNKRAATNEARATNELNTVKRRLLFTTPITSDGIPVGSLLLVYPQEILWPRFTTIVEQGAYSVLLVLAVIMPIGWLWGRQMVQPLLKLAACMTRLRDQRLETIECTIPEGNDEIGQLNARFREMMLALREKQQLERQMVTNERQAAIGRVASGIAHEINNPLGGMLVAIDTMRARGIAEPNTERTLSLLERGLNQIKDTVSALLVEARSESHNLTAQDIEDTRILITPELDKKQIRLTWSNHIRSDLSLPSTLVRQVAINLLLNAVQFTPRRGRVTARFLQSDGKLTISIENEGSTISQKTLEHLFEPYYTNRRGGSGLGLWVTYQIVQQLKGDIDVASHNGITRFTITLPLSDWEEESRAH